MAWWKRNRATNEQPSTTAEHPDLDQEGALGLILECGWSHSAAEGWVFEGALVDKHQSSLTTPDLCHDILKSLGRDLVGDDFEAVLLVSGLSDKPLIISSNTSPRPLAVTTGIESTEDVGTLSKMLLSDGYKLEMVEGTGFMLFRKP